MGFDFFMSSPQAFGLLSSSKQVGMGWIFLGVWASEFWGLGFDWFLGLRYKGAPGGRLLKDDIRVDRKHVRCLWRQRRSMRYLSLGVGMYTVWV